MDISMIESPKVSERTQSPNKDRDYYLQGLSLGREGKHE